MNKAAKVILVIVILLILGGGGFFIFKKYFQKFSSKTPESAAVVYPKQVLENKFGFLSAGPEDVEFIKSVNASWVRPHPGPFLWDAMQEKAGVSYDFSKADKAVKRYQDQNIAILATLWPFAEWDQQTKTDASKCAVSTNDEFLAENDKKGRGDYLPSHRCAPVDWEAYSKWVQAVTERYDGDGKNDMSGLKMPVKYWEVMNEPDLPQTEDGRLVFWLDTPENYATLLTKTSAAIKSADSEADVLIAGAAGGDDKFLQFYQKILSNKEVVDAFDIGNVHCISNDDYQSFNVQPYQKMLTSLGITKPIWITEAQAIVSSDKSTNATQTYESTKKALSLGAGRIFYTMYSFESRGEAKPLQTNQPELTTKIDDNDPQKAYQQITALK